MKYRITLSIILLVIIGLTAILSMDSNTEAQPEMQQPQAPQPNFNL